MTREELIERLEDAALAKHSEAGLEDEFLTVEEAVKYLETLEAREIRISERRNRKCLPKY